MKKIKAAVVCLSNGLSRGEAVRISLLCETLENIGIESVLSPYLYKKDGVRSASGQERAAALMEFYRDDEIEHIFDVSGGDIANEVLPFLDYNLIGAGDKLFWGYSDLTALINAIYSKCHRASVLYQVRNIIGECGDLQRSRLERAIARIEEIRKQRRDGASGKELFESNLSDTDLFNISAEFLSGEYMQGVLVGGNIRCLLKLAGTAYWPDMKDKVLLLEAYRGDEAKIITYFNQLRQMGVFEKISGLLLGTFSELYESGRKEAVIDLALSSVPEGLPVAKTLEIGHGADSKAAVVGGQIRLG